MHLVPLRIEIVSLPREFSVKPCVAYHFSYVRSRPRSVQELPANIIHQITHVRMFVEEQSYEVKKQFIAIPTNRDHHFANTPQFRDAVSIAKAMDCPLVFGDIFTLLCATHPEQIVEAATTTSGAGVVIVNAKTRLVLRQGDMTGMVTAAMAVAVSRRMPIMRGLRKVEPRRQTGRANQMKAARGAAQAADTRALGLRPIVESIRSALPPGLQLTPTILARELNARAISTVSGKVWSVPAARNLLGRLALS